MARSVTTEEKIEELLYAYGTKESGSAAKQIYEEFVESLEKRIMYLEEYIFIHDNLNK